jgi:hypothetical protein
MGSKCYLTQPSGHRSWYPPAGGPKNCPAVPRMSEAKSGVQALPAGSAGVTTCPVPSTRDRETT